MYCQSEIEGRGFCDKQCDHCSKYYAPIETMNLTEELKSLIIKTYKSFGDEKALLIKGKRSYTGNEIAEEIEKQTPFGLNIINGILKLSIDLLKRDKTHLP